MSLQNPVIDSVMEHNDDIKQEVGQYSPEQSQISPLPEPEENEEEYPPVVLTFSGKTWNLYSEDHPDSLFSEKEFKNLFYGTINDFFPIIKEKFGVLNDVALIFQNLEDLVLHEDTDIVRENTLDNFWSLRYTLFPDSDEPLMLLIEEQQYSTRRKLASLVDRAVNLNK